MKVSAYGCSRRHLLGAMLVLIGVLAVPAGVLLGAIALLWGGADRLIKAIER